MSFNSNAKNIQKSCLHVSEYVRIVRTKFLVKKILILLVDSVRTLGSHGGNVGDYYILVFNAA